MAVEISVGDKILNTSRHLGLENNKLSELGKTLKNKHINVEIPAVISSVEVSMLFEWS